jgi:uncharacterized hydrophobic protein (TIGR00341 family)
MSLRLIEIYHKRAQAEELGFLLQDISFIEIWHDHLPDETTITKILLNSEDVDAVVSTLNNFYSKSGGFRLVILPVEATIPRIEKEEPEKKKKDSERISIEELYQKIEKNANLNFRYFIMAILASLVASIGLVKNDVAIIIGSMVIAPLMGPHIALSFSTALADKKLAFKTIPTIITGISIAIAIGFIGGKILNFNPFSSQLASRANVGYYDIILALASGIAGVYATVKGFQEALVGVMVAVALLPPLVATGIFAGGGYSVSALSAFILFLVNSICINLSGVLTFFFSGIKPIYWWEEKKAKKAVAISVLIWLSLLIFVAGLIYIEKIFLK